VSRSGVAVPPGAMHSNCFHTPPVHQQTLHETLLATQEALVRSWSAPCQPQFTDQYQLRLPGGTVAVNTEAHTQP
jgi:hypothetical protein